MLCKSVKGQDMVPALSLSGILGQVLSLGVIIGSTAGGDGGKGGGGGGSGGDEGEGGGRSWGTSVTDPLTPEDASAAAALLAGVVFICTSFMFLTIGAQRVPSVGCCRWCRLTTCG